MKNTLETQVERALRSKAALRLQRVFQTKAGLTIVAAISFFESALPVPLITDPFMIAAILANRARTVEIVLVTIVSSVLGGLAAFAMAAFFFDIIAAYMTANVHAQFQSMVSFGQSDTLVTTLAGAITPVPYTLTAWVVAVANGNVWWFIIGSFLGRGVRYGIVGYCTYMFGPTAMRYARRYLGLTSLVVLIAVGFYIWLKM